MKVLIRADANKTVSMGHVMRCLSIADALKSMGASVLFVCAGSDAKELINKRGFEVSLISFAYSYPASSELKIFESK